jgi:DNA-binding protein H-NS
MAKPKIDKMSLNELRALDEKIKHAIEEARAKGRIALKSQVAQLAAAHGFSLSELFGARPNGKSKSVGAAKYANPDNTSDTWTGRGRKPNWLIARMKKGANLSDFEI